MTEVRKNTKAKGRMKTEEGKEKLILYKFDDNS